MQKTSLVLLDPASPYHVGWRVAEPVIEGFTVHRSLVYVSTLVEGNDSRVNSVAELRVSAALPALRAGNCYKLLLPIPPLPSRTPLKKKRLRWITLKAATRLGGESPYITNIGNGVLFGDVGGRPVKLCYKNEVVYDCKELLEPPRSLLERVEIHVNRLDRVLNAADVYKVTAYRPRTKLGVIVQGKDDSVEYACELLKLLGELGIGGMRSRGYGKFTTETGTLCEEDLLSPHAYGWLVVLGSYIFSDDIDSTKSVVVKRSIAGYAGPTYDSYVLPYLDFIGSGSIIYAKKPLAPVSINIKSSHIPAVMVFNPVVAGAGT